MRGHRFASNDEAVAYMKRVAVDASGFTAFLGVEPLRCFDGESELLLALRPDMTQHHGFAHGAIVGLMADNACAWAAPLAARKSRRTPGQHLLLSLAGSSAGPPACG